MPLTLQRKLELAGDLAKVQPLLQRLHLMEQPKKRHRLRKAILVGSAIGVAAVFAIAVATRSRCRRPDGAEVGAGGYEQDTASTGETPPAQPV